MTIHISLVEELVHGRISTSQKNTWCKSAELDSSSDVLIVKSGSDFRDLREIKIVDQLRKAVLNQLQVVGFFLSCSWD